MMRVALIALVLLIAVGPVGRSRAGAGLVSPATICYARVTISANLSVPPLNPYDVTFSSAYVDPCGMWSPTHPASLVVTAPGWCVVGANLLWVNSPSGTYRLTRLHVAGIERASQSIPAMGFWIPQALSTGFPVAIGDALTLQLQHDAPTALTVFATGESADLWAECSSQ